MTKPLAPWLAAAALAAVTFMAAPISGAEAATISFVDGTFRAVEAGEVFIDLLPGDAGFTSDLYGAIGLGATPTLIGSNRTSARQSLGFAAAGAEIILTLSVRDTGFTFSSGPAGRNPDNVRHVAGENFGGGSIGGSGPLPAGVRGGFEDIFRGGDQDFNDVRFVLSSIPVPGPVAGAGIPALMALGGFVWARRRKAAAVA
jgi:hypothetical protein